MTGIEENIEQLEPVDALAELAAAARRLLAHVDDEVKYDFVVRLIGENGKNKIGNLVQL